MRPLVALLPFLAMACTTAEPLVPSPGPPATSAAPTASAVVYVPPVEPAADPFVIPTDLRNDPPESAESVEFKLPRASGAVAKAPAICKDFASKGGAKAGKAPACADRASALEALAAAVDLDGKSRDGALARLEGCAALPVPLIRAIRASFAPVSCGEAIVGRAIEDKGFHEGIKAALERLHPGLPKEQAEKVEMATERQLRGVLQGEIVASRIEGMQGASPMPVFKGPVQKEAIQKWLRTQLPPWVKFRMTALAEAEALTAKLPRGSYGLALATSELGIVYHEFGREFRAAPVPAEFKEGPEERQIYYTILDEQSIPARTKALQILADAGALWAHQGVLRERAADRVHEALKRSRRQLAGRESELFLPAAPEPGSSAEQRLAAKLPVFASETVLAAGEWESPETLKGFVNRGFSRAFWAQSARPSAEASLLMARAHSEIGLRWREGIAFDRVLRLLGPTPTAQRTAEGNFWVALALAYRKGYATLAGDLATSSLPAAVVPTEALESLAQAKQPGPFAAHAFVTLVTTLDIFPPQIAAKPLEFQKTQLARLEAARVLLIDDSHKKNLDELIQDRRDMIRFITEASP